MCGGSLSGTLLRKEHGVNQMRPFVMSEGLEEQGIPAEEQQRSTIKKAAHTRRADREGEKEPEPHLPCRPSPPLHSHLAALQLVETLGAVSASPLLTEL